MTDAANSTRPDTASVLLLLASYSVRVNMLDKAMIYAGIGRRLYPDDVAFTEMYAHALLLTQDIETASDVLEASSAKSANLSFLRARLGLLSGAGDNVREHLSDYLAQVG